jgi:DHA1 family multidrug resistance protein-like MFS transporter
LFATKFGELGHRVGVERVLIGGFLIGIASLIPSAFVTSVWILVGFRLLIGLTNATMNPSIQTILANQTPNESISRIYSYNQSFQAMGNMIGPLLGSFAANLFGYRGVFLISASIMALNMISFYFISAPLRREHQN